MAPNGTVFLDEVGEMSTRMQVVLLRFLESGEIQRIGADRSHTRVNVRLITATNRDLEAQILVRRVPRGPLLPAERRPADHSAASRAARGHSAAGQLLRELLQPAPQGCDRGGQRRRDGRAGRLSVAGQHPRAQERRRAHCAQDERTRRSSTPICRPTSCAPAPSGRRSVADGRGSSIAQTSTRRGTGRAHAQAGRVVLGGRLSAVHVARPDAHRPAQDRSDRPGDHERQLPDAGAALQHAARRTTSGS